MIFKLVFQFPDNGIHLVTGQLVDHAVVIFHTVQMMLGVQMDCAVSNIGIVRDLQGRNLQPEITAVFHQLFQCLTAVKTGRPVRLK